ncbi:MAG: L,D-transpeptidase family protein, partial [Desulfobacterales bacterium]
APPPPDAISPRIRDRISQLESSGTLSIGHASIGSTKALPALYRKRRFRALWQNPRSAPQLLATVRSIDRDGLTPYDYHLLQIQSFRKRSMAGGLTPEESADFDILLTDSLIRLAFHVYFGKVNPRSMHPEWRFHRLIENKEAADLIELQVEAGTVSVFIEGLRPLHPLYRQLRAALSDYRGMAAAGGWEPLPDGTFLERGMRGEAVQQLRRRLAASGDLPTWSTGSDRFDEDLATAVARFQRRHRVDVYAPGSDDYEGAVGDDTLEMLNLPIEHWIDRICVNLERARWVLRDVPERFVAVDIADFRVRYIKDEQTAWAARAQVGDPYRHTPVFQSAIRYLEINPTWTVPPGILERDVLPKIKENPDYLRKKQLRVVDLKGRPVDPGNIRWSRYSALSLPYKLVQGPGPDNPLGRIKFIFPNPYYVFMHDTPDKEEFEEEKRALSAGCIRVERPFELARLLLREDGGGDDDTIVKSLNSGATRRFHLRKPLPIVLIYGTVSVDREGSVVFREDIYERDGKLLDALNGPVVDWTTYLVP